MLFIKFYYLYAIFESSHCKMLVQFAIILTLILTIILRPRDFYEVIADEGESTIIS